MNWAISRSSYLLLYRLIAVEDGALDCSRCCAIPDEGAGVPDLGRSSTRQWQSSAENRNLGKRTTIVFNKNSSRS
jgi:hypothetical protein